MMISDHTDLLDSVSDGVVAEGYIYKRQRKQLFARMTVSNALG